MNLIINGQEYTVEAEPNDPLLWIIRDTLGLTGTKFGCGAGICGSCTIHIDGQAARSCITPVAAAEGRPITTIEGLATVNEVGEEILHPVQQAFLDGQVPQCSWCMSGQMMQAAAFLNENPNPSEDEITRALNGNYCRCGCYFRIKSAVAQAAAQMQEQST
jgi:isoquinoline 1-oxidoreductase alpha subunit